MLDANIKTQLKAYFDKITQPIEITASVDGGDKYRELLELLDDLKSLPSRITVQQSDDDTKRKPSFILNSPRKNLGIRFAGLPMGHKFTSLVLALLQVGGHPPKAEPEVIEQIRNLEG